VRGAFDFEAWEWVNPLVACFISEDGQRHTIHDESHTKPEQVAIASLLYMHKREDVKEWWAHNAGKYDGLFLSAAAKRLGWEQSGAIAGGNRIITWRFRPPSSRRSVLVCDSFAVLPSKLGDIAKDFELSSGKLFKEEDYKIDPRKWGKEKLIAGCFVDCQLVLEALDKVEMLIESWGGVLKHTFSSSAMSVIKNHLETHEIALPVGVTENVNEACRRGYYGARVEVFSHAPEGEISEYDINSSYPYAMTQPLPWHYAGDVFGKEAQRAYDKGYEGIFEATVRTSRLSIPVLPYVIEGSGIYFPLGTWEASFTGVELRYAELCGYQVRVISGQIFSKGQPFADYINEVYNVKQHAKGALRQFTKLLLNGSYGKFGEKPEKQTLKVWATAEEALEYAEKHPGKVTQLGHDPSVCAIDLFRWPPNTHYALAAYITAYARMHLHRLLTSSKAPAYCDSDSVHCERDGIAEHECHDLLGGLKREISRGVGRYYAPKIYEIRDLDSGKLHLACKGFPVEESSFRKMIAGMAVEKGRMQLAKSQLRKGGLTVARVVDNKRWKGISSKRRAVSRTETVPWKVDELRAGLHLAQRSPLAVFGD
jgi:hypothetical protein